MCPPPCLSSCPLLSSFCPVSLSPSTIVLFPVLSPPPAHCFPPGIPLHVFVLSPVFLLFLFFFFSFSCLVILLCVSVLGCSCFCSVFPGFFCLLPPPFLYLSSLSVVLLPSHWCYFLPPRLMVWGYFSPSSSPLCPPTHCGLVGVG